MSLSLEHEAKEKRFLHARKGKRIQAQVGDLLYQTIPTGKTEGKK